MRHEQGVTRSAWRTALLLILASWLGGCNAGGTLCSRQPRVCSGTYYYQYLCAYTRLYNNGEHASLPCARLRSQ